MPYRETIFYKGNYFHVFCRGNEKRDIFIESGDYERFLSKMKEYRIIHQISIISYCLMPNHFHLLLRQDANKAISYFMHRLTVSYAMYFNKHYHRVGHLFQGSFKAKLIRDDAYILQLSRYIHSNPREIVSSKTKLENYPWSSYPEYLNLDINGVCEKEIVLQHFNADQPQEAYKSFVEDIAPQSFSPNIQDLTLEPQ